MRILWVKAGRILPVNTGGRIRSFNILRHLARQHDVTFLSYYDGPRDAAYESDLAREFPGSIAMPSGLGGSFTSRVLAYATHLHLAAPFAVSKFSTPAVRRAVSAALAQRPDVAVCDFLAASLNFDDPLPVPTVLFQHNVESALWDRQATHERNLVKRIAFTMEAAKMRRYEAKAVRRFSHVIAVSEHDRTLMSAMRPASDITSVPTGVDVAAFRDTGGTQAEPGNVMFLGSMDWPANIDGVDFFVREVWPLVLAKVPTARFNVVGRNPPKRILDLASDSVRIVGGVETVTPHLHRASVFVVPLRIGGGTRLKIYEGMAASLPIVSTRVGAEGLDYTAGTDILIEDDPAGFASSVVSLLTDEARRRAIGDAALATAMRFDWSVVAADFARVLETVRSAPK